MALAMRIRSVRSIQMDVLPSIFLPLKSHGLSPPTRGRDRIRDQGENRHTLGPLLLNSLRALRITETLFSGLVIAKLRRSVPYPHAAFRRTGGRSTGRQQSPGRNEGQGAPAIASSDRRVQVPPSVQSSARGGSYRPRHRTGRRQQAPGERDPPGCSLGSIFPEMECAPRR